jgi:hypothetical protein
MAVSSKCRRGNVEMSEPARRSPVLNSNSTEAAIGVKNAELWMNRRFKCAHGSTGGGQRAAARATIRGPNATHVAGALGAPEEVEMVARRLVIALGMALVFPGIGSLAVARQQARRTPASASFVLFLNEGPQYRAASGAGDDRVAEYSAWARSLAEGGSLVSGEKLRDGGFLMSKGGTRKLEARELPGGAPGGLGGYFVVKADDYDAAKAIAATCPHLKYGGTITLRAIEDLSDR